MVQKVDDGAARHRGPEEDRPHHAGGQPARQFHRLSESQGSVGTGSHRAVEPGGSMVGPQLGHRRLAVFHSAGRLAGQHRLGPLPRHGRRNFLSIRSAFSAGATIATMARAWQATCSFTCFPACTSSLDAIGPSRVFATGGLRFWKDGRDVPDVMLGLYDYRPPSTPGLQSGAACELRQRCRREFGFRFVGSEGIMNVGNGVTLETAARIRARLHHRYLSEGRQEQFLKQYHEKYPVCGRTPTPFVPRPKSVHAAARLQRSPAIITASSSKPCGPARR